MSPAERKAAWIAEQLGKAPALDLSQQNAIRAAFAGARPIAHAAAPNAAAA